MNQLSSPDHKPAKIILHAAGLSKRGQFGKGKEAVLQNSSTILVLFSSIRNYVVERAHHHTIASRVPDL